MSKINKKDTRTKSIDRNTQLVDVALVCFFLSLNILSSFFFCFLCYLWTSFMSAMNVSCNFCYPSFLLWLIFNRPADVQLKRINPLCWAYHTIWFESHRDHNKTSKIKILAKSCLRCLVGFWIRICHWKISSLTLPILFFAVSVWADLTQKL